MNVGAKTEKVHATFEAPANTNTTWDAATKTFTWSTTYYNQLRNIGLPTGDLSKYKKLVVDCTIKSGDQFRILFYKGGSNMTLYASNGVNEFILADTLKALSPDDYNEFLLNCDEICLSGNNAVAPGEAIINDVYLETYDDEGEKVYATFEAPANTNTTWDATTKTFTWSTTYYNQLRNIGLPTGDITKYKKLVVDTEIKSGDQFRILFYKGGSNKTLYASNGVNEFILADTLKALFPDDYNEFLLACDEICLSGNDAVAPGEAVINSVYLETYPENESVEIPDIVYEEDPGKPAGEFVDFTEAFPSLQPKLGIGADGHPIVLGNGDVVVGQRTKDVIADLSEYSKLTMVTTPGLKLVLYMNHEVDVQQNAGDYAEGDAGKYVFMNVQADENGLIEVDLTQFDKQDLNCICLPWDNTNKGTVWYLLLTKKADTPAEDVLPIDIQFGADYNSEAISSYAKTWTATKDGKTWTLVNFNNNNNGWSSVKCGSKNNASVATITSPAVNAVVTNYVVSVAKADNVNAATLTIMNGEEKIGEAIDITAQFVAGDVNVPVEGQAGYSYVLTIDNAQASGNGSVEIIKIALYGEGQYVKKTIANTAETAYTVAEAIQLIDAGEALTDVVFVKGIVSKVDKFESKSITYWISEDGTTESAQFECYKGKGIDGADFASINDILEGAEIIATGNMKKYGETYEFDANNALVSYTAPAMPTEEDLAVLNEEIAIAKSLGVDVTAYETAVFTAAKLPAAIEALKVAEYAQVNKDYTVNAATLIPDFSQWEGEMVSNKGQHWDGTGTSLYYEQTGAQWGQSAWTNNKKTTVTLPKGKYVLYAAGRASAGTACTAYMKVNDVTRIYTSKGDVGFGIATDGTASFDAAATYANGGKGRGFEYRYVAFEVTAEEGQDIALEVGGEATAEHQWMSFTAPVLLTTEDNVAIMVPVLNGKVTAAKADLEAAKGTVGDGLFMKPQAAYDEYAAAVADAEALAAEAAPTAEAIKSALAAIDAKAEAFANAPVTAPDADKAYTFQLRLDGETPLYMALAEGGITIAEEATPLKFVANEAAAGQYYLANEDNTLFVGLAGGNAWTMSTLADKKAAWTFTALPDGAYRINNLVTAGRFVGTNAADKEAGKPCYADKKTDNGNIDWIIAEYAAPFNGRIWDFTQWSDATVANLIADAAASKTSGWSDVEKKADAEADADPTEASKDNCFWYAGTANEDGSLSANGVVIEELKGLVFSNSYAPNRSLAIAVNYPTTTLGDYAGGAYLWLGGGKKKIPCFTIPEVAAGSTITMEVESHKPAEGRGVELYYGLDADGLVDAATKIGDTFNPTVKESHTWTVETAGDVIVYNTNGCHIYTITVEEGTPAEQPLLTLKAPVGEEVNLTFGVYDTEDTYSVDFGDGNLQTALVGIDNKGPVKEDGTTGSATKFTGTVAGDGTIKVYGKNDIWYLLTTNGAMPTSFDQPKLMNVVQMSITGADVESVTLPAYEKMTQFNFNNSSAKSIDVSKVTGLTSLKIDNTSASKLEPQLESIDLSKNVNLESLSLQGNNKVSGKLTSLDLTNNTKLTGMGLYVQYNQISELKLGENSLTLINVQNNQLKSIDLTKLPKLKSLYAAANLLEGEFDLTAYETMENVQLNDNKLTGVKVNNVTKQFYVDGNQLTLATIPAQPAGMNTSSKTKQFHYAPQADLEVALSNMELDLTSQLTIEKGELNPDGFASWLTGTTTFSFLTAKGDTLVEGTDYEVTEPGKFKFLKEQTEKVYAVMLNTALPKFTAEAPFKTAEFEVKEGAAPILADFEDGKYYFVNVSSEKSWGAGNNWGTQGSLVKHPEYVTLHKQEDGTYFMETQVSNGGESYYFGGEYMDGSPVALSIVQGEELGSDSDNNPVYAYYVTVDGTNFYGWDGTENTVLARNLAADDKKAQWIIVPAKKAFDKLAEATAADPMDATFLILDPDFGRNNRNKSAWTGDDFGVPNGNEKYYNAEKWGGNSQTFDISQTVDAPNGKYKITWNGFYRYNNTTDNTNDIAIAAHADGTEVINSFIYINGTDYALTSIADDAASAALEGKLPFSQQEAGAAFAQGLYAQSAEVIVTDGKLTIGIKKIEHPGTDWTVWDNFEIEYYGAADDTAVETVKTVNMQDGAIYDLQGRRVAKPGKGLYIINGKKVSLK